MDSKSAGVWGCVSAGNRSLYTPKLLLGRRRGLRGSVCEGPWREVSEEEKEEEKEELRKNEDCSWSNVSALGGVVGKWPRLGNMTSGFSSDEEVAELLSNITGSNVSMGGRVIVLVSRLPAAYGDMI